jgi:phosphonate transport system ATP-binding protein
LLSLETVKAIELHDVWFSYGDNSTYALRQLNLQVESGSWTAVIGPTGAGKTTLLKIIRGLLNPQKGSITFLGAPNHNGVQKRIGYIPQQLGLIRNSSVLKNVLIGSLSRLDMTSSLLGRFPDHEVDYAQQCLKYLGLGDKMSEKVHQLSGGERQRVAIARTLMQKPSIILADEFTAHLDKIRTSSVINTLRDLAKEMTLIISTHNLELALEYSDRIICLKNGTTLAELETKRTTQRDVLNLYA